MPAVIANSETPDPTFPGYFSLNLLQGVKKLPDRSHMENRSPSAQAHVIHKLDFGGNMEVKMQ